MSKTKGLIKALEVIDRYLCDDASPVRCEENVLYVNRSINRTNITVADDVKLSSLGFSYDEGTEQYYSLRYGDC